MSTEVELKLSIKLRLDEAGFSSKTERFLFWPYLELIQLLLSEVSTYYDFLSLLPPADMKCSSPSAVNPSRLLSKPASLDYAASLVLSSSAILMAGACYFFGISWETFNFEFTL